MNTLSITPLRPATADTASVELLAALLIRARSYERQGLPFRPAVLAATNDLAGDPARVLRQLREPQGAG